MGGDRYCGVEEVGAGGGVKVQEPVPSHSWVAPESPPQSVCTGLPPGDAGKIKPAGACVDF